MSDCISRQAAIDALVKPKVIDVYDHYWDGRNTQYKNDVDAIADLPSAQPEVIRCKDCRRYMYPHGCNHIDGMTTAQEDGYCSYAERRTDE